MPITKRKVRLVYFTQAGKYKYEGEYETSVPEYHDFSVYDEVRAMFAVGKSPGVMSAAGFNVLVEPENGVPCMIYAKEIPNV